MSVPKTNLFKGDRVRLSDSFIVSVEMMAQNGDRSVIRRSRERRGTIDSDTLNQKSDYIRVLWDGINKVSHHHVYMPVDLELVEEEEVTEFRRSPYMLLISFRSNERPWRGTHDAYKIFTDEEAIEWARKMEEGMGTMYDITLVRVDEDGKVIETMEFRVPEAY